MGSGNNEWGSDNFYPIKDLVRGCEFTLHNKIVFSMELEVLGRGDLIDNADAAAIEKTFDEMGLIDLADHELVDVISKLPAGIDVAGRKQHEDDIVRFRAKR